MGILDFFEKSAGKWFSQRTSYKLGQQEQWHQSDNLSRDQYTNEHQNPIAAGSKQTCMMG